MIFFIVILVLQGWMYFLHAVYSKKQHFSVLNFTNVRIMVLIGEKSNIAMELKKILTPKPIITDIAIILLPIVHKRITPNQTPLVSREELVCM